MTLEEYRKSKNHTYQELAEVLGESQPLVWLWCKKDVMPKRDTIKNIRKKTKKKVDYQDWFEN